MTVVGLGPGDPEAVPAAALLALGSAAAVLAPALDPELAAAPATPPADTTATAPAAPASP